MVEKKDVQEAEQNGNEAEGAPAPQSPGEQTPNADSQNAAAAPGSEPMDTTTPNEVSPFASAFLSSSLSLPSIFAFY
jgi:hypothetical protein